MKNELLSLAEAADRIRAGHVMTIAGDAPLLAELPKGKWIGGTSVYFVTDQGGAVIRDKVFCTTFSKATDAKVRVVGPDQIGTIPAGYAVGGMTLILIPAFSQTHTRFAIEGADHPALFGQPLAGWIAGVHLDDLGAETPKVVDGETGTIHEDGAALLHISLPEGSTIDLDIINIFDQDNSDTLVFQDQGFSARTAIVNGQKTAFADYLNENSIDTRLPLVANYAGSHVNVSVQSIDDDGNVQFYAPVLPGIEYRLAKPIADYAGRFAESTQTNGSTDYSCNCILNYLYGELEGKTTGNFTGPITFGEIAYILLNQTLVRVTVN